MIMEFLEVPKAQRREELFLVCVQDFEDEYHKDMYDPSDKLLSRVRLIRRRYKTTYEYQYAINLINMYIARLMLKYGGEDKFISLLRSELIDEYLPPIPRMKGGSKNKYLVKNKIIVSAASFKKLNVERLNELAERYNSVKEEKVPLITFTDKDDKRVKEVNKIIDEVGVSTSLVSYVKSMDISLFDEYFINRKAKQKVKEEEFETDVTMTDILDPNYKDIVVDVDEDTDEFVQYRSGFIHRNDVETINNIDKLGNLGWDKLKLTRRILGSKNILNITKHESKKEKKKRRKREAAGNAFLLGLAGQSDKHSSFGDFEEAMLDFTSENRFK